MMNIKELFRKAITSLVVVGVILTAVFELAQAGDSAFLVKDIYPGLSNATPTNLTDVNGTLFFSADDGDNGRELWTSHGTVAGTVLVKDIASGSRHSYPAYLTSIDEVLFFSASDGDFFIGDHGRELWKSDGSSAGTVMVKDIFGAGTQGSDPAYLTAVNGTLFFSARIYDGGPELWKSDGTAAGTVLVKDVSFEAYSTPMNLTNVNGLLFFSAYNRNAADLNSTGRELWKSDGTTVGTVLVHDISPGKADSSPAQLTPVGDKLFFTADNGQDGIELWALFEAISEIYLPIISNQTGL